MVKCINCGQTAKDDPKIKSFKPVNFPFLSGEICNVCIEMLEKMEKLIDNPPKIVLK